MRTLDDFFELLRNTLKAVIRGVNFVNPVLLISVVLQVVGETTTDIHGSNVFELLSLRPDGIRPGPELGLQLGLDHLDPVTQGRTRVAGIDEIVDACAGSSGATET